MNNFGQPSSWDNFTAKLSSRGHSFDEIKNASDRKTIINALGIHDALEIAAIETEWTRRMGSGGHDPHYQQQPQPQGYNTTASAPPAFSQFQQQQYPVGAPPSAANHWGDVTPGASAGPPRATPGGRTIRLDIKTLTGATVTLESVDPNWTVSQLKMLVSERMPTAPHPDQQRLIFAGKQLENQNLLSSYNLGNGCTLHLVLGTTAPTNLHGDVQPAGAHPKKGAGGQNPECAVQ